MKFDLKPCPFCGGEARLRTGVSGGLQPRPTAWVKCQSCDSGTPAFIDSHTNGENILEAIDTWNNRAEKEVENGQ